MSALALAAACAPAPVATRPPPPPAPKLEGTPAPAPAPASEHPDDDAIAKAGDEYLALLVEVHPETATQLGLHARDGELDDRGAVAFDAGADREEALLRSLEKRFEHPRASQAARTDLALLLGELRAHVRMKRVQRPLQRDPGIYLEPLEAIFSMTARSYAPAPERARSVVARLEKIPSVVEQAKANLLNPPRVWTDIAIERASSAKAFLDEQRPFLLSALPGETAKVDAALKKAATAYDDYRRYLQKEVVPRSNGRFAAGRELFEHLLKNDYFLDGGADALLAMGKKVFAETNAQLTELARRMDPAAKGWPDVARKLKAKHPSASELLDAYRKEVARSRAFLVEKDVVAFPPGDELDVIETPVFMRGTLTAAYDQPPPFDGGVSKGFFFVTPVDTTLSRAKQEEVLREHSWTDIVNTAVHETYPGHHLQLSFARRSPSKIRRALDRAVFSEGWALYCEQLMAELGYYDDSERLLQLEWALVRAARVILDVGLHVGDMTFEAAVKLLTDEVHLERPLAMSEVKRYTTSPTQPSAYMLGREGILALRERARKQPAFSLKAFHADLLGRGTIPPALLEKEMFPE